MGFFIRIYDDFICIYIAVYIILFNIRLAEKLTTGGVMVKKKKKKTKQNKQNNIKLGHA